MDDNLLLIDETKSLQWNYVNRVEKELTTCNEYQKITMNPLLPDSYKEVVMVLSKACNHSRIALLIDDDEQYVAFMLIVDEEAIPFMLEDLEKIETPATCIYKVFTDDKLARSHISEGKLQEFMENTVIPDLNTNFDSWNHFIHP